MRQRLEVAPGAEALAEELGWHTVEQVFASAGGEVFARSGTSSTVRLQASAVSVFLKRYDYPRFYWRHALRASRARREWRSLALMTSLGIPAAERIAWGEERRGLRLVRGFIATRGVEAGKSLDACLQGDGRQLRELAVSLAAVIAHMHGQGFLHRDLYPRNIIVQQSAGEKPAFHFIDAPKARGGVEPARCLLDLATLAQDVGDSVPRAAQALFLRCYLEGLRGTAPGQEELASAAAQIEAERERLEHRAARRRRRRV